MRFPRSLFARKSLIHKKFLWHSRCHTGRRERTTSDRGRAVELGDGVGACGGHLQYVDARQPRADPCRLPRRNRRPSAEHRRLRPAEPAGVLLLRGTARRHAARRRVAPHDRRAPHRRGSPLLLASRSGCQPNREGRLAQLARRPHRRRGQHPDAATGASRAAHARPHVVTQDSRGVDRGPARRAVLEAGHPARVPERGLFRGRLSRCRSGRARLLRQVRSHARGARSGAAGGPRAIPQRLLADRQPEARAGAEKPRPPPDARQRPPDRGRVQIIDGEAPADPRHGRAGVRGRRDVRPLLPGGGQAPARRTPRRAAGPAGRTARLYGLRPRHAMRRGKGDLLPHRADREGAQGGAGSRGQSCGARPRLR